MADLLIIPSNDQGPITGTSLTPADEFRFPLTENLGGRIHFEIEGHLSITPGTGGGVRMGFSGPSGAELKATGFLDNGTPQLFEDFDDVVGGNVSDGVHHFRISGVIRLNGAVGEVILRFCENVAGNGGVSLLAHQASIWAKTETGGWS